MAPKNQRWWLTTDQVELEIGADADALYRMVSDLPRIGEWSPECERVEWEGDVTTPVEGTTFIGHNAVGPGRRIRYSRHGRVLAADPGREFAFVTDEGGRESTVWRYRFEPNGDGDPGHRVVRGPLDPDVGAHPRRAHQPPQGAGPRHAHHARAPRRPPSRPAHSQEAQHVTDVFTATPGVDVISTTADIPALGSLAINAFVLHGAEPLLVDTGTVGGCDDFIAARDR